ncbi:MAG: leucine-rich repeat domain-containing protein, partial [Clostridia bacterium]|nr:leucine-rich repeat domain-containing protein [Clostridia bacterium]
IGDQLTHIGNRTFKNLTAVETVIFGASVATMGYESFMNCTNLVNVQMNEGLTAIGSVTFSGCTKLANVTISSTVTTIDNSAFKGCTSLQEIEIPRRVTRIGKWCFEGAGLINVTIPENVLTVDEGAFKDCASLENLYVNSATCSVIYSELTVPETTVMYGYEDSPAQSYAMAYDRQFVIIDIMADLDGDFAIDVNTDGTAIISKYRGTDEYVTIPTLVGTYRIVGIGNSAFANNTNLKGVIIGGEVATIGDNSFSGCTALENVTFGNNVKTIGIGAFYNCDSLTSVILPDNIESVGLIAFNDCNNLQTISVANPNCVFSDNNLTVPANATVYGFANSAVQAYCEKYGYTFVAFATGSCGENAIWTFDDSTGTLYITGTGRVNNYINVGNTTPWLEYRDRITAVVIGDGITYVGNRAFRGLNCLVKATFGKDVTSFGYELFYNCNKLTKVEFNEGLTNIGALCFYGCTSLRQIHIPSTVTNIQNRAFKGSGLTSVIVPDTVKTLGYEVFMNCTSLEVVQYTRGASMLNPCMFENCTSLRNFVFTRNMCRIRSRAFYGCTALEGVNFEDANNMWGSSNGQEARIASDAFDACSSSLVLIAKSGSHVQTYAANHSIRFSAH